MAAPTGKLAGLLSPVFLRVAVGITFIWAGLGKIVPSVTVSGVDAALLANAGVTIDPAKRRAPSPSSPSTTPTPPAERATPAETDEPGASPQPRPPQPLPLPTPIPTPAKNDADERRQEQGKRSKPKLRPLPSPDDQITTADATTAVLPAADLSLTPLTTLKSTRQTPPTTPHTPAEKSKKPADAKKPTPPAKPAAPSKPSIDEPAEPAEPVTVPESIKPAPIVPPAKAKPARAPAWPAHLPKGAMSATDYPEPMSVARVNELSLLLIKSAFPAPLANGQARMSVWPQRLALDPWPRYVAWLAAMTELICGLLVLAGFFTRMSSALLSLTMLTAMWLTQIGPAVASGDAVLGILPNRTWWEPAQWATLLWQLAIVCMCLALVAAGPGWLSLDRFFTAAGTKPKKTAPEPDDE